MRVNALMSVHLTTLPNYITEFYHVRTTERTTVIVPATHNPVLEITNLSAGSHLIVRSKYHCRVLEYLI